MDEDALCYVELIDQAVTVQIPANIEETEQDENEIDSIAVQHHLCIETLPVLYFVHQYFRHEKILQSIWAKEKYFWTGAYEMVLPNEN